MIFSNFKKTYDLKRNLLILVVLFLSISSSNALAISVSSTVSSSNDEYSLDYATFFGGKVDDYINDIAIDDEGAIYVTGTTASPDFPILDPFNITAPTFTFQSAFVAKFDSNGHLLFSTYLGGSQLDLGYGIAVDQEHNFYVVGDTRSSDFPILNAYQNTNTNGSFFITKFNSNYQMSYSTFLGGSAYDYGKSISVDQNGNAYVCGYSNSDDFKTKNAFQTSLSGNYDAVVAKLSPDGDLIFSTYYGGNNTDYCYGLQLDQNDNIYISGSTLSDDLPLSGNAYSTDRQGSIDTFYAIFDSQGNLTYATFLGGSFQENNYGLKVDSGNNIYLYGATQSIDFPVTSNAYNTTFSGLWDVYVTKFSPNNSLSYSTFIGGNGNDFAYDLVLDDVGNIYITGYTGSTNYPVLNGYSNTIFGSNDVFITKLNSNFNLQYSTYYGGTSADFGNAISVDSGGNIITGGYTFSADIPIKYAFNATKGDNPDGFITIFKNQNGTVAGSSEDLIVEFQMLLENQIFVGILGLAIVSVLVNILFLLKRK